MAEDVLPGNAPPAPDAFRLDGILPLDQVEQRYLDWAQRRSGGNVPQLARQMGVSVRTLYRKLKEASPS